MKCACFRAVNTLHHLLLWQNPELFDILVLAYLDCPGITWLLNAYVCGCVYLYYYFLKCKLFWLFPSVLHRNLAVELQSMVLAWMRWMRPWQRCIIWRRS